MTSRCALANGQRFHPRSHEHHGTLYELAIVNELMIHLCILQYMQTWPYLTVFTRQEYIFSSI